MQVPILISFLLLSLNGVMPQKVSFAVPDGTPQGTVIGNITASPGYSFEALDGRYFTLTPTGTLRSSVVLYKSVVLTNPYSFAVRATNQLNQSERYFVYIFILVTDPNAPRFDPSTPLNLVIFAGRFIANPVILAASTQPTSSATGSGSLDYTILAGDNGNLFVLTPAVILGKQAALLNVSAPPSLPQVTYGLTISAQDSSTRLSGYVSVSVQVVSPADYQPTLSSYNYSATVQVNLPPRVPVLQLRVTAPAVTSDGSMLRYAIANNSLFVIDAVTGTVTALSTLGTAYKTEPLCSQSRCAGTCLTRCSIPIWAVSRLVAAPAEQLTSQGLLTVDVTDAASLLPDVDLVFEVVNISEGAKRGDFVTMVTISDPSGGEASVAAGDPAGTFAVTCERLLALTFCRINVNGTLDYQSVPRYSVVVQVRAGTRPFVYYDVTVHVVPLPLSWPTFAYPYYVSTADMADDLGTVVAVVQAGGSQSGKVVYSILPGVASDRFVVHPYNGEVSLGSVRNTSTSALVLPPLAVLNVSARDWIRPDLVTYVPVYVYLAPQRGALECSTTVRGSQGPGCTQRSALYPALYYSSVYSSCAGYTVGLGKAESCILANLSSLQKKYLQSGAAPGYSIVSGTARGTFDTTTGGLVTVGRQVAQPGAKYRITASISAAGNSSYFLVSVLTLIRDLLEQPLAFEYPAGYSVDLYRDEATMPPVKVLQVTAYGHKEITYAIADGDPDGAFSIATGSGDLFTVVGSSQLSSAYQLTVVARGDSLLAFVKVDVKFLNSTTPPVFSDGQAASVRLSEDAALGEVVYVASARGRGGVTYSMSSGGNATVFSLDNATGILRTAACPGGLTALSSYSVPIVAKDRGPLSLTSTLLLTVYITDVNDHSPRFAQKRYTVAVSESTQPGQLLAQISATDNDSGSNGLVSYEFGSTASNGGVFAILPEGWLQLVSALDREQTAEYNLFIVARDGGIPQRSATVPVKVWLVDVNDNAPSFSATSYAFTVAESSTAGIIVGVVTALDPDSGRNGRVLYSVSGEAAIYFDIHHLTGVVTTSSWPLDREKLVAVTGSSTLKFSVIASDEGQVPLTSSVYVTVTVLDINDNAPLFFASMLGVSVDEGVAVGSVVAVFNASDADADLNACITYSLVGRSQVPFVISGDSLIVSSRLDREMHPYYQLVLAATDEGSPMSLTATSLLSITILDVNDNQPVFVTPVPVSVAVAEDTPPSSFVTRVWATDSDAGSNTAIEYSIVGENVGSRFAIDKTTGVIYTVDWLDHESVAIYGLQVAATNAVPKVGVPQTSKINVTILVTDANEPPQFANASFVAYIDEIGASTNTSSNKVVVQVTAVDPDKGTNGALKYSIIRASPEENIFGVDPSSGLIYVQPSSSVDYERVSQYTLTVAATDQGESHSSRLSATARVDIFVRDANDNSPVFMNVKAAVTFAGSPAGTFVILLKAMDTDAGSNGQVLYSVTNGTELFTVDAVSGRLVLRQSLESSSVAQVLSVAVQATDRGLPVRYSQQAVDIVVLPNIASSATVITFTRPVYTVTVPESTLVGADIITVALAAMSPSAQVGFYITSILSAEGSNQASIFDIDRRTGRVHVMRSQLCNHTCGTYNVTVYAVDNSSGLLAGKTQILVSVISDKPPAFDSVLYSAVVRERGPVGEVVLYVCASDSARNSRVIHTAIVNDTGCKFGVNSSTGAVLTSGELLYGRTPSCRVMIVACNSVGCANATLIVTVLGRPAFTSSAYYFTVLTGASAGFPVGRVLLANAAAASDEGSQVTYALITSWQKQLFRLDSLTGVLSLQAPLADGSQAQLFMLEVLASITGSIPSNATATMYITVDPDPQSTAALSVLRASVAEDAEPGSTVMPQLSKRPYAELGGRYSYVLSSGDPYAQFAVSAVDGSITTTAAIDRETVADYELVVSAVDPVDAKITASATVLVTVLDVNDNSPIFTSSRVAQATENSAAPLFVIKCTAYDLDIGSNGLVEYILVSAGGTVSIPFVLNNETGILTAITSLDREVMPFYNVTVMARDHGRPARSTLTSIIIVVGDVNDNDPQFVLSQQTSTIVPEDTPAGAAILTLVATDADAGINGTVRYNDLSGDGSDDFFLDSVSGVLSVGPAGLNFRRRSEYALRVQATDLGIPQARRSLRIQLSVSVTRIEDAAIAFLDTPFYRRLMENIASLPACMGQLPLVPYFGNSHYDLLSQGADFVSQAARRTVAVDPALGYLTAVQTVDREAFTQLELTCIVVDPYNVSLDSATLTVTIVDINDNAPMFEVPFYIASVPEGKPAGTVVVTVAATDADSPTNANITYSLAHTYSLFAIDSWTGVISLLAPLDREARDSYVLYAIASDNGIPQLTTRARIIVNVDDVNDNKPLFMQPYYAVSVPSPVTQGSFLVGLTAVDLDFGINGSVSYSLLNATADFLRLNSTTGVIMAAYSTTLNQMGMITFTVRAYDGMGLFTDAYVNMTSASAQISGCIILPQPPAVTVSEAVPIGTTLFLMNAASSQGQLTYWIAGGNVGDALAVDPLSGEVRVRRALDYEATSAYGLWISVAAGLNNTCAPQYIAANVIVNDVNDNAPQFSAYITRVAVQEELDAASLPRLIATINASDADSGVNGTLRYRLSTTSASSSMPFYIDSTNGSLFVTSKLDRETVSLYTLLVEAYDLGPSRLTSTAAVVVTVADINDNAPSFVQNFAWAVAENAAAGTIIGRVTATDRDVGKNAFITYSLIDNIDAFTVTQSGMVIAMYPLDREATSRYTLTIVASNTMANSVLSTATKVDVTVLDVNDNVPSFVPASYSFVLPTLLEASNFVGAVTASDADAPGPNSLVSYRLLASSMLFNVNSSGSIFASQRISYTSGTTNRYMLYVLASDRGSPPLTSNTTVAITFTSPANTNMVVWSSNASIQPVPDDLAINTRVVTLKPRAVVPALVKLNLTAYGNASSWFAVSPCGDIILSRPLTGYRGAVLQLSVRAVDVVTSQWLSEATVTLPITAPNAYAPAFLSNGTYEYSVNENVPLGFAVATLRATDPDSGYNGQLKYYIVSGNDRSWFTIGETNGILRVASVINFTAQALCTLVIKAEDQGFTRKSVLQKVIIKINTAYARPSFSGRSYIAYVKETSSIGTLVVSVSAACQPCEAGLAAIAYSISASNPSDSAAFMIDSASGDIRTAVALDYTVRGAYTIAVTAYNPLYAVLNDSAMVLIGVISANRYPPTFLKNSYQFPWPSIGDAVNGSVHVGTVEARDFDRGAGGVIQYFLLGDSNGNGFTIDSHSGVIRWSQGGLVAETSRYAALVVLAKNIGPLYATGDWSQWSSCPVEVGSLQQPFAFSSSLYNVSIADSTDVGTCVLVAGVVGAAGGTRIAFTLSEPNVGNGASGGARFTVDFFSGAVTVQQPLMSTASRSEYILIIKAVDADDPRRILATTTAAIYTFRRSDAAAFFTPMQPQAFVLENLPASSFVTNLLPLTRTRTANAASTLFRYSLNDKRFRVDALRGIVVTAEPLVYAAQNDILLPVVVACSQGPNCTSALTVRVTVLSSRAPPKMASLSVTVPFYSSFSGSVDIADFSKLSPWRSVEGVIPRCTLLARNSTLLQQAGTTCRLELNGVTETANAYTANVSVQTSDDSETVFVVTVKLVSYAEYLLDADVVVHFSQLGPAALIQQWLHAYLELLVSMLPAGTAAVVKSIVASPSGTSVSMAVQHGENAAVAKEVLTGAADAVCAIVAGVANVTCQSSVSPCTYAACQGSSSCIDSHQVTHSAQAVGGWPAILVVPTVHVVASCSCTSGGASGNCTTPPAACKASPCKNGGTCQLLGYTKDAVSATSCLCVSPYFGQFCEKAPVGFVDTSYAMFSIMPSAENSTITLAFATFSQRALLLYQEDECSTVMPASFLALQLADGRVTLTFYLGDGTLSVATVDRVVNTGAWFRVSVWRTTRAGCLQVTSCHSPADCNYCFPGDVSCSAMFSVNASTNRSLGAGYTALAIGGLSSFVPDSARAGFAGFLGAATYVGCVGPVTVDGSEMSFDNATGKSGLKAGCGVADVCGSTKCGTEGMCSAGMSVAACLCLGSTYSAESCDASPAVPVSLGDMASVSYRKTLTYQRLVAISAAAVVAGRKKRSLPDAGRIMSLFFRTAKSHGTLLYVNSSGAVSFVQVVDGQAVLSLQGEQPLVVDKVMVNDSAWHQLDLRFYSDSIKLSIDGIIRTRAAAQNYYARYDPLAADVQEIVLGKQLANVQGFNGCLRNFTIDGEFMPIANAATGQFTAVVTGTLSYTCTLCDSSCGGASDCSASNGAGRCEAQMLEAQPMATWLLVVIIVVSIVVTFAIVLALVLIFFTCKKRRRMAEKAACKASSHNALSSTHSYNNGAFDAVNSNHDVRHTGENDFANPLAARSQRHGLSSLLAAARTVPSPASDQQEDNVVIIENSIDSGGERREFYDMEVASIAPSEIDLTGYYNGYRSSMRAGKTPAERGGPANPLPATRVRPKSAVALGRHSPGARGSAAHQQRSATAAGQQERQSRTPQLLVTQHLQYMPPAVAADRQHLVTRRTPIDELQHRAAIRCTPVDELQRRVAELSGRRSRGHPMASDTSDVPTDDSLAAGRSRPGSRPNPLRAESRLAGRGTTPHSMNRLTSHSQSSDSETDGTLMGVRGLERRNICLDDSTSDGTSNDSFTASEFEAESEPKIRNDQHPTGMLFTKLHEADDESDATDSTRNRPGFNWENIRNDDGGSALSRFLPHTTLITKGEYVTKTNKSEGSSSFRWDYFFNWGPSFEKLVGVFTDIAKLPSDDEAFNHVINANVVPSRKEDYV